MAQATGLERELDFFEKHRGEYVTQFRGLYVLIKDEEMHGPFPTAKAAYEAGLARFGFEPFLVKQVLEEEPIGQMPIFYSTHPPRGH